jgi:predicted enzyme related to lactoylglutathione lyase
MWVIDLVEYSDPRCLLKASRDLVHIVTAAFHRSDTSLADCRVEDRGAKVTSSVTPCSVRDRRTLSAMATHWTLGCDAADPHRLAAFWAFALGYVDEPGFDAPDGASIVDPDGKGPVIGFLRVPEVKTAKNRMHIDVRVAGEPPWDMVERERLIRAKVAELVEAGASAVREEFYDGSLGHVVMHDPEGNEFCVA